MNRLFFITIIFFSIININAQKVIGGNYELLKKINSFPEEYLNRKIILNDIWMSCESNKVLKSNYYSISLYMNSNDFPIIDAYGSNNNSVITKKLAKKIINDGNIDTENMKYLANIYGSIRGNIYWFAKYTFVVDKIEIKSREGVVIHTFQ